MIGWTFKVDARATKAADKVSAAISALEQKVEYELAQMKADFNRRYTTAEYREWKETVDEKISAINARIRAANNYNKGESK